MKRSPLVPWLTALSLLLCLCLSIMVTDRAHAGGQSGQGGGKSAKVSPDLRGGSDASLVKVILQLSGKPSGQLNALLNRNGVHVRAHFQSFNSYAVELPADVVDELASFDEVSYVSLDRQTQSFGHITLTTGADAVRQQTTTSLLGGTTTTTLDGTGIGIAVLDSGVDSTHRDFLDKSNGLRVVYSQDFTGEGRTDDPYGHGTHVASIAAGNGRISNGAYVGIAPNANIVNLRVLNSQGTGTVSAVLGALNWLMSNRAAYNVRVVNMSLGMPAIDSYKNDPVCKAVRSLVNAGVVVTVAAGNNGKNSAGQKIYGQIHSPGNEPSAITVGASNTFGTDARGDDAVTTYSSRGPTRSYWTDSLGAKHYDNLIKPDIVAPGNKLIYAEAADNLLVQQN
ncbi:MAG: S8 family serine peptidase, partial [Acidobacteriota bacterium]|nr:S8 family serine peptidase [Acidobacteriota bacterium]